MSKSRTRRAARVAELVTSAAELVQEGVTTAEAAAQALADAVDRAIETGSDEVVAQIPEVVVEQAVVEPVEAAEAAVIEASAEVRPKSIRSLLMAGISAGRSTQDLAADLKRYFPGTAAAAKSGKHIAYYRSLMRKEGKAVPAATRGSAGSAAPTATPRVAEVISLDVELPADEPAATE